jgi:hypothetical protein
LLLVQDPECAQYREPKGALLRRSRGAKRRGHGEIGGERVRLIIECGPPTPAFELLQCGDVWPLFVQDAANAPQVVAPIDTDTRVDVVGHEREPLGDCHSRCL